MPIRDDERLEAARFLYGEERPGMTVNIWSAAMRDCLAPSNARDPKLA